MLVLPSLAGAETTHLFPFRDWLLRTYKIAGLSTLDDFRQRFERFPLIVGFRSGGIVASEDGSVRMLRFHADY